MERLVLIALGLAVVAGCGSSGSNDGQTLPPVDGGADATLVNLDGGGAAPTPPDGKSACPAGACNYQAGTGCSGTTTSCLPLLTPSNKAAPTCIAPGTVPGDGACTAPSDCVTGHLCAAGVCRKLCCGGDWTGCDSAAEHCLQALEYGTDAGVVDTGAMVCTPVNDCDALNPSSCTAAGTTCQIADPTGVSACLPEGTGTAGAACPCKGGYTCVTPPGKSPVCVRLCKAVLGGGAPFCDANEGICTHYNRDPAGVGECQPPG